MLPLWDASAEMLRDEMALRGFAKFSTFREHFQKLITIMADPRKAKPSIWPSTSAFVLIYDETKAILTHGGDIRRRHGKRARYEPFRSEFHDLMRETVDVLWGRGWNQKVMRTDSVEFYRVALSQQFGGAVEELPDAVLEDCVALWNKPAEAACVVLGHLSGKSPDYIARRLPTLRRRSGAQDRVPKPSRPRK